MPDIPSNRETGNAMTIGIVLAGIVAALILVGSFFLQSDQKGVDVTVNQPSTESPTTGETKRHRLQSYCIKGRRLRSALFFSRLRANDQPPLPTALDRRALARRLQGDRRRWSVACLLLRTRE